MWKKKKYFFLKTAHWYGLTFLDKYLFAGVEHLKTILKSSHKLCIMMQNIQIFYGGLVMFVVTCFWVVVAKNGCSPLDHGTLKSAIYIYISQ